MASKPTSQFYDKYALAIIVFIALLLRVAIWFYEPVMNRDGILYIEIAETWFNSGEYLQHHYLPMYPWLIKTVMILGVSPHIAGVVINIVLGSVLPILMYLIIRCCSNSKEIALSAALIMAVHPSAMELSRQLIRDNLYLFFSGIAIIGILKALKSENLLWWALVGVATGANLLTRYESLEFVILVTLYFLVAKICGIMSYKQMIRSSVIWLTTVIATFFILATAMNVTEQVYQSYGNIINSTLIRNDNLL